MTVTDDRQGDERQSARKQLAELLEPDSPALALAARFRDHGHRLLIVGGVLRDALIGRRFNGDLDLATSADPEETLAIVRADASSVWLQGMQFGTVGAEVGGVRMEITTFRSERYPERSRHPEVSFEGDIAADLVRRDFTINAMALDPLTKEMLDPFGGRADLDRRRIATPGDPIASFTDDPLRMLRAFRFASELGFTIADDVLDAVAELRDQLKVVSAERIRDELTRLVTGEAPGNALRAAEAVGLTPLFLPELSALKLEQDPVHRHKDVFAHTLAVVERTDPEPRIRLAALLHDIGKPRTRRIGPEGVSFHHHEVVGADMARRRLRELRYPNATVDAVAKLIRLHHRFHTYRLGWTDSAVRRYVRDAGPLLSELNRLVRADCTTRDRDKARRLAARMDELEERIDALRRQEELDRIRPELDGHEVMQLLGVEPGPIVGRALAWLLEMRLDEGPVGRDEAQRRLLEWARREGIEPPAP